MAGRPPTRRLVLLAALVAALTACASLGRYHTVQKGETAYQIAQRYGVTVDDIASANHLRDPNRIYVGDRLYIPLTNAKQPAAAARAAKPAPAVAPATAVVRPAPTPSASRGAWIWPARGVVLSRFGKRGGRMHNGVDIAGDVGAPIFAARDGEVIFVSENQRGYGKIVIVQHDERYISVYAHNSKNLVELGRKVRQGETIALVGQTGNATAPHVHFEIRDNRKPVDPLPLLP